MHTWNPCNNILNYTETRPNCCCSYRYKCWTLSQKQQLTPCKSSVWPKWGTTPDFPPEERSVWALCYSSGSELLVTDGWMMSSWAVLHGQDMGFIEATRRQHCLIHMSCLYVWCLNFKHVATMNEIIVRHIRTLQEHCHLCLFDVRKPFTRVVEHFIRNCFET